MASYQRDVPLFPRSSPALTRRRQIPKSFPASRWKENLRRACLENARKRRRDLVMRKRGQHSLSETNDSELTAKNLITEQCQKYGVGLLPSSFDDNSSPVALASSASSERRESTGQGDCMDVELEAKFLDSGGSALTEDDLFEILREVEEELRIDGKLNTCRSHRACYHISFSRFALSILQTSCFLRRFLKLKMSTWKAKSMIMKSGKVQWIQRVAFLVLFAKPRFSLYHQSKKLAVVTNSVHFG